MMYLIVAYWLCMSDYRYAETDWKAKVFFIRFPKSYMDRTKADRWANDRRREGFTVASTKKDTYCIAHYIYRWQFVHT